MSRRRVPIGLMLAHVPARGRYVTDYGKAYPNGQCLSCGASLCKRDREWGWHCLHCLRENTRQFGLHSKTKTGFWIRVN
jgi:hypothetical protein